MKEKFILAMMELYGLTRKQAIEAYFESSDSFKLAVIERYNAVIHMTFIAD